MDDAGDSIRRAARDQAYAMPLADIQPLDAEKFRNDTFWPYFERLRAEAPPGADAPPWRARYAARGRL